MEGQKRTSRRIIPQDAPEQKNVEFLRVGGTEILFSLGIQQAYSAPGLGGGIQLLDALARNGRGWDVEQFLRGGRVGEAGEQEAGVAAGTAFAVDGLVFQGLPGFELRVKMFDEKGVLWCWMQFGHGCS